MQNIYIITDCENEDFLFELNEWLTNHQLNFCLKLVQIKQDSDESTLSTEICFGVADGADLITFIGCDNHFNFKCFEKFLLEVELCSHEASFIHSDFVAYKVNSNGFTISGIRDGHIQYSGMVISNNRFEQKIIKDVDLPHKCF